ncbi:MAG: hypothetical protein RL220_243 [Bacteroidota bacterium]
MQKNLTMRKNLMFVGAALIGGFVSVAAYELIVGRSTQIVNLPSDGGYAQYANYAALPADGTLDFTAAAERSVHAVVHVKTTTKVQGVYNPWLDFFGYDQSPQVQQGTGSGVILSQDGYIITNNHVVEGAQTLEVTLNNNKTYEATLIGADPSTDIAVIKIEEKGLPFMTWGNSDDVRVGQWVLAVGNPFDLTSTVTAGIVSAKARNINLLNENRTEEIFPVEAFIQTDAAVNPGNSGGALVNTRGELIGINTAIASRTGVYSGYSFAVPASIAKKIAEDLMNFGSAQRAFIGVRIQEVTQEIANEKGLSSVNGVFVNSLTEGGAAADAGIVEGDIILKVGEKSVNTVPELQEQVSRYRPGDKVNVTLWRNKKMQDITVTLRNKDGNTSIIDKATASENAKNALGAELANISEDEKSKLGLQGGAKVIGIGPGKLQEIGIQKGFIITKINDQRVYSPDEALSILGSKKGMVEIEGYYPNGTRAYYGFGM